MSDVWLEINKKISRLETKLAELRKDRERLDWLQEQIKQHDWSTAKIHSSVFVQKLSEIAERITFQAQRIEELEAALRKLLPQRSEKE